MNNKKHQFSEELQKAISISDISAIQNLIKELGPNARSFKNRTPLIESVIAKNSELIRLILDCPDLDVNLQDDNGWSALHFAAQNLDYETIKLLLEKGALVDIADTYGNTPLFRAVFNLKNNNPDAILLLLSFGADRNHKNKNNVSAWDLANTISNYDCLTPFLDYDKSNIVT